MSSTASSETAALLEPQMASGYSAIDPQDREHDRPVQIEAFFRNARRCKIALGLLLPIALGLEVAHFLAVRGADYAQSTAQDGLPYRDRHELADVVGGILLLSVLVGYLISLARPMRQTSSLTIAHSITHRRICTCTFLLLLLANIIHSLPCITFVVAFRGPPPVSQTDAISPGTISATRWVVLVLALFSSGCMRRGPKLRFDPMQLGTGFGISSDGTTPDEALEKKQKRNEPNVIDYCNSSMLDFILLSYISPLAFRSYHVDQLRQSDLPHLEEKLRNSGVRASVWAENEPIEIDEAGKPVQKQVTSMTVIKAVWYGRGSIVLISLALETIRIFLSFLQVVAMHEVIESFKLPAGSDRSYAYLMCWGLFVGQACDVLLSSYLNVRENYLLHQPIRMTLASLLFAKILRSTDAKAMEAHHLSDEDRESTAKGRSQVMNILTIDTGTIASLATKVWKISNALIGVVIGGAFLYSLFGVSAFVGIACVPLTSPIGWWIAKRIYECDKSWLRLRDARTGAIKEFLLGIKVIKLNAWELHFRDHIQRLRDIEVQWQRWRYTLGTLFNIQADQMPVLAMLLTFVFHTKILGRPLDPSAAFVGLTIFNRVKDSLSAFPDAINALLEAKVALDRITRYLNQPEVVFTTEDDVSDRISLREATLAWPVSEDAADSPEPVHLFKMRDMTLEIPTGQFTLVCGPLGSGKTLLLRALLGEARIEAGSVLAPRSQPDSTPVYGKDISRLWTNESWLNESVAYAPQQAYIRHGTVRDNILFGQPMWEERYSEVLRQCSLLPDLDLMPDGDLTEIGEHGVNLSGGQKARINLARCVYSRAKTIYLDDILSAVDAHTAQFIFEQCLTGSLLRGRTVVLVTHHVGLCLPGADYLVMLTRDGVIDRACPAADARISDSDLIALGSPDEDRIDESPLSPRRERKGLDEPKSNIVARQHYAAESQAAGRVASSHYMLVFRAAGGWAYWLVLIGLLTGARGVSIWQMLWMERWSGDPDPSAVSYYIAHYAGITLLGLVLGSVRWVWLYGVGNVGFYNAGSRRIHSTLLDRICGAPMSFFETTPGGRLMNLFGQDINRLDSQAADDFGRTVMQGLVVVSAAIIITINSPVLILLFFGLGMPFFWVSGVLGKLRADLRRLTAICFSPLISLYHDTIDGVVMVRAFGSSELAYATLNTIMNREKEAHVADWTVYNWVRGVLQTMCSVVVAVFGFLLVGQNLSAAMAGFVLSYAVQVSQGLFMLLEQFSSLEQTFVSAERINQYISMDAREPTEGVVPPPEWPSQGRIEFKDLRVRYAEDLPEVLHGVTCSIEPGMRVGLVGSTGSGKSTLALSLFRAVDPSGGSIEIDGMDIASVALHELRGRLNMVVQDGSLCSGTLREALDITGTKDDHEVYEALRRVHLLPAHLDESTLKEVPFANLDTFVAIEGANFSQGERQLLCLARALLKHSRILVMDEATSSVDMEMDAKITQTIKECFAGTTMIVIAHRLATIMHYDRVMVLDKGRVKEYGRPIDLVENEGSAFHGLCMAQGQDEFDKLLAMARA